MISLSYDITFRKYTINNFNITSAPALANILTLRLLFIVLTILCECIGTGGLAILDANTGYYECESCHERFVPAMKEYVFGLHTMKKRKLPCPKCGKKTWCSKKISKE